MTPPFFMFIPNGHNPLKRAYINNFHIIPNLIQIKSDKHITNIYAKVQKLRYGVTCEFFTKFKIKV